MMDDWLWNLYLYRVRNGIFNWIQETIHRTLGTVHLLSSVLHLSIWLPTPPTPQKSTNSVAALVCSALPATRRDGSYCLIFIVNPPTTIHRNINDVRIPRAAQSIPSTDTIKTNAADRKQSHRCNIHTNSDFKAQFLQKIRKYEKKN